MTRHTILASVLMLAGAAAPLQTASAANPGTAFNYQGTLENAGSPVTTPVDIQFRLYNEPSGFVQVGSTITKTNVMPTDGVFSTSIDFGAPAFGVNQALWMRISVRPAGSGSYEDLGLQPLTATPFALNTRGINVNDVGEVGIGTTPTSGIGLLVNGPIESFASVRADYGSSTTPTFTFSDGSENTGMSSPSISELGFITNGVERIRIADDGKVGIGTASPATTFDVNGAMSVYARAGFGGLATGNVTCRIMALAGDFPVFVRSSAGAQLLAMASDGRLAVGPTFSNEGITVDLPVTYGIALLQGNAIKPGGGSWAALSDRRYKKNIHDLDGSLDTILKLRGVNFEYKDPESIHELPGVRTGFIAQEVEEIIPDWVSTGEDGYKSVTIRGFEALAVEAMRELKSDNDELRGRIDALESRLDSAGIGAIAKGSFTWPAAALLGLLGVAALRRRSAKA